MSESMCPRCGEPVPAGAKFCPNCGSPVGIPAASERRLVTVVFVDLVGSTELASSLDPERFREVLAAFHAMVTEEIEWLRGRTEAFIGDAVLGVFGVPTSHDDDAVRAIRASLAIVERAGSLGRELGLALPMRVHVGVNTGQVAVGTLEDRGIVIGAEVNIGARLQQAAAPGEVLVGRTTHQLVQDAVEFGEARTIHPKGFDGDLPAWPVVRLAPRSTRSTIPFVDRRRELALLNDTFERVQEHGRAHLVTLLGEPGIGKSRVVDEFVDGLPEGTTVLTGRPSPFEERITFWPLSHMILHAIDEDGDVPADELRARLRQAAISWVGSDEADRVARRLGLAMGLEEASSENRYQSAEVRRGVLAMLGGLAVGGPVVLVFEDLHVAEPPLLDLIEHLMRDGRRLPLLVICVARWGFLDDRPGWAGGLADAVTLWVEPLGHEDAVQLAIEAGDLRPADADRVAEHAGGNPFFIVEITGMLMREEGSLPPTGSAPSVGLLPPTVQAVIASRIDSLSPQAGDMIRTAAVFPRGVFDTSELAMLVEPKDALLTELEDAEFLVPDEGRAGRWRFRSDVLRDVAYESLAKRERQRLHLRLANRLSEPETAERYPRAIAYHLEQAAISALDLNPRDRTLADRAVDALAHAGDQARRRIEARSATELYQHALALAGPEEAWGTREASILSMLGEALYWLGEFDLAEQALQRALDVGAGRSDTVTAHASRFLGDIQLTVRGDGDAADELFERALVAARRLGDRAALARTLLMAGWVPFSRDDLEGAGRQFGEALEVARSGAEPDRWAEVRALVGLASVTSEDGDEADALALAEEGLAIGRASGQEFTTATAEEKLALGLRRMLRLDEAMEHAERAIRTYRELGARWELAGSIGDRGVIHRLAGRLEEAETELREAFALCRDLKERGLVTWTAAELAKIQVLRGDVAGARQTMEDPAARLAELEPGSFTALLVAEAVLALAQGDRDTARERSLAAVALEERSRSGWNAHLAQVWWTARIFGSDEVGGEATAEAARVRLEAHHWRQALLEPELTLELLASASELTPADRVERVGEA